MVTGASRGLGREVAKAAFASGDKVIATGRQMRGWDNRENQDAWLGIQMDVTMWFEPCCHRCVSGGPGISSISHLLEVYRASARWGVYGSTKFAVEGITEALHDELAPLGIHVTVVEPGFFRTDFMDNRSLLKTGTRIADYEETVGKTRIFAVERNHRQPGDPAKLAQAVVQLVNAANPPLRLPFGTNALETYCTEKCLCH
jgi:NAD(P)-dependent dehydrogenase (short-subunit alcohol dehydrogenase family)